MDYDEAYSFLNYARRPLYQGLADYNSTNNHLLNTGFMHVAYRFFGPQEWALRLHVLVAGVGLVGSTYLLGRRLHRDEVGLVAAALVATTYVTVNYSVNARGYIWTAWMTVLLLDAFRRIAAEEPQPRALRWLGAGLVAVLGVFAIPTMAYSILGCIGWLSVRILRLGRPARWRLIGPALWTSLVGLAALWLYAPAFVLRGVSALQHPFVKPQHFSDWFSRMPAAWWYALKSGTEGPVHWLVPAAFVVVGLVVLWWMKRDSFWLIAAVPLATFVVMTLQRVAPPPRIFSFLTPLIALVAASGLFATCQLIYLPRYAEAPAKTHRQVSVICSFAAASLCALSYSDCQANPLPGGLRPAYLVEDVAELWAARKNVTDPSNNQLWRLSVIEVVVTLRPDLQPGDRVLVGLPLDLPFHFYATQLGWTTPIGGQPQPGERLLLVLRGDEDPQTAVRDNLSLRFTDPWILQAQWQQLASGDLAIWQARPVERAATESNSR
jgi:4-amino-4-deoxy-L-arabinose transferase-like glycosyltransferase